MVNKIKSISNDTWITIIVILIGGAISWGNTTSQIADLERSQVRQESKLDGVIAEQSRVAAQLAATQEKLDMHIHFTEELYERKPSVK